MPEPVGKLDGAVMIRSIQGFGCVEGLLPRVLAAALAVALAGCNTIQPTEMTASLGVTAPEGEPSALGSAERYRAHPDDSDAAINYARVLRGYGQYAQALAVLERYASRLEGFGIRPDAIELFVVDEERRLVRRGN